MISTVSSMATSAVAAVAGQKKAMVPVEPVAPVKKVVKRRIGHADDVFKAGNAIGTMITIASGMSEQDRSVEADDAAGAETPATQTPATQTSGAGPAVWHAGTSPAQYNAGPEAHGMESLLHHATGTGPRAEWARAYLEAQEKRGGQDGMPSRSNNR